MNISKSRIKRLNSLFVKYLHGVVASDELSELQMLVNVSNDEELDFSLRSLWLNNEYLLYLPTEEQQLRMMQRIERSIQKSPKAVLPLHKRFIRISSHIAAVLVIGLFTTVCMYLYRDNRRLSVYQNNEITLSIGNGQEAGFTLPDGTTVRLNSGSTLRYANNFGKTNRFVSVSGEAFFDVKKDETRPFIVHTNHLNIEVLGTAFNVYAYDRVDFVEMTLLSGSVKATSTKHPEYQIIAKPNEKVICDVLTGKLTLQKADANYEAAWIEEEIVFKSEPLSRVLEKLERKYGVCIHYEGNPALLNDLFSGHIGKDNTIDDAMKIIAVHYLLKYERKNSDLFLFTCNRE
ncbi:MAG: FecR domain-containing protein [Dysgonamonadaceae bacterium]|nr:FecR domain-containing protein [Dysgonamonadaceae bacterium]